MAVFFHSHLILTYMFIFTLVLIKKSSFVTTSGRQLLVSSLNTISMCYFSEIPPKSPFETVPGKQRQPRGCWSRDD